MLDELFTASSTLILPLVATATVLASSGIYWYCGNKGRASKRNEFQQSLQKSTTTNATTNATPSLKSVWDAPRNVTSQQNAAHPSANNKPFGSKYYYAHNNPNATGGYKDGLKMEDYTMNGPRLLSKGGKPVLESGRSSSSSTVQTEEEEEVGGELSASSSSSTTIVVRHITKYLWDDPGDSSKGIATIRIDSLPSHHQPPVLVDWKDVKIDKVDAKLAGEGLLVQVHSSSSQQQQQQQQQQPQATTTTTTTTTTTMYQLKIPKLYGDVVSVQAVVKPKRLLIKLTKKKASVLSRNKSSNMDAWPQPHRKI
jgi:hypothetical protein